MKSSDSHKAVHAHGKRKNLVLSLVFCVAALCVVLLVLVGPGRMLAGAAARSGVETALPASVAAGSGAPPPPGPGQTPAPPRTRSGERRVGEKGRSRWSPCHLKKKKNRKRLGEWYRQQY